MKIFNIISKLDLNNHAAETKYGLKMLLKILCPICPHICYTLWQELEFGNNIFAAKWPKLSSTDLISKTMKIIVQINGKKICQVDVQQDISDTKLKEIVFSEQKVSKLVKSQEATKRIIIVPKRLINIVT